MTNFEQLLIDYLKEGYSVQIVYCSDEGLHTALCWTEGSAFLLQETTEDEHFITPVTKSIRKAIEDLP